VCLTGIVAVGSNHDRYSNSISSLLSLPGSSCLRQGVVEWRGVTHSVGHQLYRPINTASAGTVTVRTRNVSTSSPMPMMKPDCNPHAGDAAEQQAEHGRREDQAGRRD